jgi:hypothetical protein
MARNSNVISARLCKHYLSTDVYIRLCSLCTKLLSLGANQGFKLKPYTMSYNPMTMKLLSMSQPNILK